MKTLTFIIPEVSYQNHNFCVWEKTTCSYQNSNFCVQQKTTFSYQNHNFLCLTKNHMFILHHLGGLPTCGFEKMITLRWMPESHQWSWSSKYDPSLHLITWTAITFSLPTWWQNFVISNSAGSRLSWLPRPHHTDTQKYQTKWACMEITKQKFSKNFLN